MMIKDWTIKLISKEEILEMYKKESPEDSVRYVFGLTQYPTRTIYINKDMHEGQIIQTLKHELTHAYIWNSGLYNAPHYTDEMVCDIVACSNDFINQTVKEFERYVKENGTEM